MQGRNKEVNKLRMLVKVVLRRLMENPEWKGIHLKPVVWWQPGWTVRDQEAESFYGVVDY